MNPALRVVAIILGGIAAFAGFIWLSFRLDATGDRYSYTGGSRDRSGPP